MVRAQVCFFSFFSLNVDRTGENDAVVCWFELCRIKLLNATHTKYTWPLTSIQRRPEIDTGACEQRKKEENEEEKEKKMKKGTTRSITQNKWLLNAIIHYQEYENEVKEKRRRDIHVERFRLLIIVNCSVVTAFSILR